MTTLRQALYGIALLGALGLLLWGQYQGSQANAARATLAAERQQQAEQRIERQAITIATLDQALQTERTAQASLRSTQNLLRQGLSDRETQIQELKRENADLRQWAEQPLPAAARRLRQRPALTGAAAYRDWLSRSGALRPASDQPSP
jgi:LysB family phage lysis regulatory protein